MDVAQIISHKTEAKIVRIPFPENLVGKYQKFTCSNNEKISLAGYNKKRISLEDGIERVMNGKG